MAKRQSLRQRLGEPPLHDSLAAISWMQRALAAMASDVLDSNLAQDEKREQMLKIADRMAKLRDPDRLYQAEEALRAARSVQQDASPGPQLKDAANFDGAAGPIAARRGRPPRRALS